VKNRFVFGVAIVVALAVGAGSMALILGSGGGSKSEPAGSGTTVTQEVVPGVASTAKLDGVTVDLPPGAVARDSVLSLSPSEVDQPSEANMVSSAIEVNLDNELQSDATIEFGRATSNINNNQFFDVPSYLDEFSGSWMSVDAFNAEGSPTRARTSHFTPFALLRFAGIRGTDPTCEPNLGKKMLKYVSDGGIGGDKLLLSCAETDGTGAAKVKLVNNRGYLMPVKIPKSLDFKVKLSSSIEEAGLQVFQAASESVLPDRTVLVPGGSQLTLTVPVDVEDFTVEPKPNQGIAAFGFLAEQIGEIGLAQTDVAELLRCVFRGGSVASRGEWFEAGEIVELIIACSKPLVKRKGKSVIGKVTRAAAALLVARTMANIFESNLDQFGSNFHRIVIKAPPIQEQQSAALAPPSQDGTQYIGAITLNVTNSEDPAVRVDYWVDQPIGSGGSGPPEEALQACNANYSITRAHSVYVRGKFVATNEQGQFPQVLGLQSVSPVGGYIAWGPSTIAIEDDGYWTCGGSSYTLDPGESVSEDFWLLIPALDEQNPVVTEDMKKSWSMDIPVGTPITRTTPSGPGAVNCDSYKGDDLLMLYGRPPFSLKGSRMSAGSDEEAVCK